MGHDRGVMRIRVVVPEDQRATLLQYLRDEPAVCHLVESSAVSEKPSGSVVEFDIPLESANPIISELKRFDLDDVGSITAARLDVVVSAAADRAKREVPGDESQAVVWAEVSARTQAESRPTVSFFALMVLAVLIAAIGILTDSPILIVGAMVVGPEFGPMSNVAYGLHRRRPDRVRQGVLTLIVGFGLGIGAAFLATAALSSVGRIPQAYEFGARPLTSFISHPDLFSAIVAVLAGVAGTVSLVEAKSNALVGVFISVTTVPAAANVGVALAMGQPDEARGALVQLLLNVTCIVLVAAVTMTIARSAWHRVRDRQIQRHLPDRR